MKNRKVSPVTTVATAALIGATPVMAVSPSSSMPPAVPLSSTPALVVEPGAGATNFKRLKKNAMLAKHNLLSEINRVEQVSKPAQESATDAFSDQQPVFIEAASSFTSPVPATSPPDEAGGAEYAVLSDTSTKVRRPSGIERRKGRPQ